MEQSAGEKKERGSNEHQIHMRRVQAMLPYRGRLLRDVIKFPRAIAFDIVVPAVGEAVILTDNLL